MPTGRSSISGCRPLQRRAARIVALRPAGAVLQAANRRACRPQGQEGPGLRPVAREVHREARRCPGDHLVRGNPVCDHGPELRQFRRLARGHEPFHADRVPIAFNAYGINLNTWKKFTPEQQAKLETAFKQLDDEIWTYSKELFDDAVRCNVGKEPCTTVRKYGMTEVPVSEGDLKLVREAIGSVSFPAFAEICDKSFPGCSAEWKKLLGPDRRDV